MIDKNVGAMNQVNLKPDWSEPAQEFPMFAQEAALTAYARAAAMFGDPAYRQAADRIYGFLKNTMAAPGGGFYASMGLSEGEPGVDKRQYARETAQAISGLLAYYDATGVVEARDLAISRRALGVGQSRPARRRLPPRRAGQGRSLSRRQCRDGEGAAGAASLHRGCANGSTAGAGYRRFHRNNLHRSRDRRLRRLRLARRAATDKSR